jgi:hypothetical protein
VRGFLPPFQITYYLNGHHYIERELLRCRMAFRKDDNAFLAVADPAALQAAADRSSADLIRKRLDYWTLIVGPKFSQADRQAINLKRHDSIQQVEYCRNLIFRRHFPIHKLFERSCDISLLRLLPDKVTQIFGFRISKRWRGKLQSVLEKIDHGHHVFRVCGRNAVLRMDEKFSTFLRLEALSNNLKDFRLKKSLENLAAVRQRLAAVMDRFAAFEAEALNVHVDFPLFQCLALPITSGRTRVPGIKIHDTRMIRLMEVLLHSGTQIGGWRTAQIHETILAAFGLKASHYTLTQLRYDLRKMKAHGLIQRDGKRYAYRLTRKGIRSPSYSCSFTNASAGLLPTACSTHYPTQSSNPPPGSKRLTAKPIIPFNRFSISSPPDDVREKSSDQKLKKLRTLITEEMHGL